MGVYKQVLPDQRLLTLGWDHTGRTFFLQVHKPRSGRALPDLWEGIAPGAIPEAEGLRPALVRLGLAPEVISEYLGVVQAERKDLPSLLAL